MRSYNVKNRQVAKVIGYENLTLPHLNREISVLMEENGIGDVTIVCSLIAGLNSKILTQYRGKAIETEIADFNIRHKFLQIALKIKGMC